MDADFWAPPAQAHRHAFAFAASVLAHVIVVLAIIFLAPAIERPHNGWVLAYLVDFGETAGARPKGDPASASSRIDTHAGAVSEATTTTHRAAAHAPMTDSAGLKPHRRADDRHQGDDVASIGSANEKLSESSSRAGANRAPDSIAKKSESNGAFNGIPGGAGSAMAGDGEGAASSSAHVRYGRNPVPIYPAEARRHAEQGTVLIRVLVADDGSVKRVELVHSSGFDALDDTAMDTVRTRWRFVPARRDGVAIESWVRVPIRFALTEASAH